MKEQLSHTTSLQLPVFITIAHKGRVRNGTDIPMLLSV